MHDALLRCADQSRLGLRQGCRCAAVIAGSNGLFDLANRGTHARAPRFVNDGAAHGLPRGFLGGFRISHTCWTQRIVTGAALIGSRRNTVNGAARGTLRNTRQRRGAPACYPGRGSGDAFRAYPLIACNCSGAVSDRVSGQGWLHACPALVVMDMGEERFDPRHQRLAVE